MEKIIWTDCVKNEVLHSQGRDIIKRKKEI